jgi:hypothetical protein
MSSQVLVCRTCNREVSNWNPSFPGAGFRGATGAAVFGGTTGEVGWEVQYSSDKAVCSDWRGAARGSRGVFCFWDKSQALVGHVGNLS